MKRERRLRKMSEYGINPENISKDIKNDKKVCKCENCVCNKNKMKKDKQNA